MAGLREAALAYAGTGLRVFPVHPDNPRCDGSDCGCKAPITAHGCKEASCDTDRVARWWRMYPEANIGIATGDPGPDVLDVDRHGVDGMRAFRIAVTAGLTRGYCLLVMTPSQGYHLWFRGTAQRNGSMRGKGLDFRSTGGYVLAPPSRVHGRPYEVLEEHLDANGVLSWEAVRRLVDPRPPAPPAMPGNPTSLVNYVSRLEPGCRNEHVYWAMRRAIEEGSGGDLEQFIAAALMTGLPEAEVRATAASALRGGI